MKNYKFRLYPNKIVEVELNKELDLCRWTYNRLLEELNKAKGEGKKLKQNATQKPLVNLKEDKLEFKDGYSKTLMRKLGVLHIVVADFLKNTSPDSLVV
ncbi:MAG: helix-turn-helix domain-containing protein [Candidatus Parvarchaeota archaeon]|nr:helix-turn-helix domain-containing protein [Candidatus Parvarchaeota archaeon]MCL5106672.1 helix-turn-helix domain-containing protein [Candidatus Parvarchaeota archaeon]